MFEELVKNEFGVPVTKWNTTLRCHFVRGF